MFSSVVLGAFLGLSACAFGTVTLPDTCTSQQVDFGAPPELGVVSIGPATSTADLSAAIKKIKDVTKNTDVTVTKVWIDNPGDFSWVTAASVSITGSAKDGSTPKIQFGTWQGIASGNQILLNTNIPSSDLIRYMSSGPLTFDYTVSGLMTSSNQPKGEMINSVGMCFNTSGDFSL